MKRGIHAGRPESSPRLQRVLTALRAARRYGDGLTTRNIVAYANVCAVNTCIAELRAAGYDIECKPAGVTEDGSRVYVYRLLSEPTGKAEAA